jgi:surface carbohydrate biosynthesis protein
MRSLSELMFRILRLLGHEIVAWDEEGLVRFPTADYYRRRLSTNAFQKVSILFAWGADDAEAFRKFPGYHGAPIHATGNPRVDLMRKELLPIFDQNVADLRRRFGKFILVNTNFGYVNSFVKELNLLQPGPNGGDPVFGKNAAGMTPEFAFGLAAHKGALFKHFREALPSLGRAFPDHSIVLRPHPSEDHQPWKEVASGTPNIHVVNEGNVIPWLMATELLIHNGCSTAVEAAILGKPAVSYQPENSEEHDLRLPNSLSHPAHNLAELEQVVRKLLSAEAPPLGGSERRLVLERHVSALEGPLAADRIVDVLLKAGYADRRPPASNPVRFACGWAINWARTANKLRYVRKTEHRNSEAFHAHRFPGVTPDELLQGMHYFGRQLGRFHDLRVWQISDHIFRIEK